MYSRLWNRMEQGGGKCMLLTEVMEGVGTFLFVSGCPRCHQGTCGVAVLKTDVWEMSPRYTWCGCFKNGHMGDVIKEPGSPTIPSAIQNVISQTTQTAEFAGHRYFIIRTPGTKSPFVAGFGCFGALVTEIFRFIRLINLRSFKGLGSTGSA